MTSLDMPFFVNVLNVGCECNMAKGAAAVDAEAA